MKQPHQEHELNQRWNTDKHRAAEPQPNSSPSRFLRVLRAFAVKVQPRIHREAAKRARISRRKILSCQQRVFGLVVQSSPAAIVEICVHLWFRLRFHQKSDFWISPSTSSADRARGRPVRSISFLSRRSRIWLALRSTSRGRPASRATSMP